MMPTVCSIPDSRERLLKAQERAYDEFAHLLFGVSGRVVCVNSNLAISDI